MNESSPTAPGYGPCAAKVRAVLGRVAALSALEIVALAQARRVLIETDTWNAALDSLSELTAAAGRRGCAQAARDEATRLTRLAARTAAELPAFVRTHLVSHGSAFRVATATAARLAATAAAAAVVADKLAPASSAILTAPWRAVTDVSGLDTAVTS